MLYEATPSSPCHHDRATFDFAAELIAAFGAHAAFEAATRAARCRDIGNHVHFCRWRQVERLIVSLSVEVPVGTLH